MKKLIIAGALTLSLALTGCSAMSNSIHKTGKGMSSSDYVVYKMSNQTGRIMEYAIIRDDILSNEDGSDGYYWIGKGGLLHGIAGDVDHHEVKGLSDEEVIKLYNIPDNALRIPE